MRTMTVFSAASIILLSGTSLFGQIGATNISFSGFDEEAASGSSCDADCCSDKCCDCCCEQWFLFPQCECGVNVHGWINGGFMGNTSSPNSRFNGPYNAVDRSNEAMLNQMYMIVEKGLPDCGMGVGGRVDFLYGEDYLLAESIGIEKRQDGSAHWNSQYYGIAFPQAYVSVGSNHLNFQVGHFYSVVGYEGVMAPDNFFYSKSLSYQFAGPFTHWGGQVNWRPNDAWTFQLGLHNGWDAFDRVSDDIGVVGKVRYDCRCSDAWTSFAVVSGKDYNDLAGVAPTQNFTNRTRYSWLVSVPLGCRTEYVFHHWLGFQEHGAPDGGQAEWYGVDQYLYYTLNDCWKAGARFEMFRDEEGTRVGLNRPSNPNTPPFAGNFYSLSLGMNWTPNSNLTVRPEIRADWYDGSAAVQPFDDGTDDSQFLLGVDAILRF